MLLLTNFKTVTEEELYLLNLCLVLLFVCFYWLLLGFFLPYPGFWN